MAQGPLPYILCFYYTAILPVLTCQVFYVSRQDATITESNEIIINTIAYILTPDWYKSIADPQKNIIENISRYGIGNRCAESGAANTLHIPAANKGVPIPSK
ncbi:hypothetical protein SAMN05421821_11069 [Mucilaginibacter lappiensis]|uniref:Uncharacterized protein n=1 Tax=Mucilaginibacter lappiensis TaxID=354630 RepID=A0ABR6PMQ3_9SPHI|nr:hypothetical protein [Mucilaginibacter lappiensis]MBB6111050.1 hypothetical protein [Mucilaginibacter lappiensis]SIR68070.1 hypothetical protein SAMN05421821_11069 [Mucilaginibacter lappiensis]